MEVATEGDFNVLFMKFNRKGKYVMHQEYADEWYTPHSVVYTSKNHGNWVFCGSDEFWERHADRVKAASVYGVMF